MNELKKLLKNPPVGRRSVPFWAWNDRLDPEELKRQIRDMKKTGMGGLFIHSREGLETKYLSDEWMDCVAFSLDEGEKEDLEIWIYDEDKWPSGSAGGFVSSADKEHFTARGLTAEFVCFDSVPVLSDNKYRTFYYLPDKEKYSFCSLENQIQIDQAINKTPVELLVLREEISGNSEWYNNSAPTDNLNPEAIRHFLKITHDAYETRFSDHFGKTLKGFFTDEPNFCDFFSSFSQGLPWLPWSSVLEDYFLKQRGYPISRILPLLFFHGEGEQKARYDYWLTLTELFSVSYMKQLYDWCDKRNLELTGHLLFENDLGYSIRVSGAAMPHYRYFHAPGIDLLAVQTEEYLTAKQCTSVANQYKRESVFTETYGCSGWELTFAEQKKLGDWQYIMGVNRRCQHLALYSMKGCRKRDYPPSFNYHNSWWLYQSLLEDYFARLSLCVSAGEIHRKLLVLHPVGDSWMDAGSDMKEDLHHLEMNMGWLDEHILSLNQKGESLKCLAKSLLQHHYDFDFGDELIIKTESSIKRSLFRVAKHHYNHIIVPGMRTLMSSTINRLKEFLDGGGNIFWLKPFPVMVDAEVSSTPEELLDHPNSILLENQKALFSELDRYCCRPVRMVDRDGFDQSCFLSMTRETEEAYVLSIINQNGQNRVETSVIVPFSGEVTEYDPWDNTYSPIYISSVPTGMEWVTRFEPLQSKVYFINKREKARVGKNRFSYQHPHASEELIYGLSGKTRISLNSENVLILDRCRIRLVGEEWGEELPVWMAQKKLREQLGMRPVYYNGAPQRYTWLGNSLANTNDIEIQFLFHVEKIPLEPVYAVIEASESYSVSCNGIMGQFCEEIFLDRQWNKHKLNGLKEGVNVLTIGVPYHNGIEWEDIYVIGHFGVSSERKIIESPVELYPGDWCFQGLYHYPGSVSYHYKIPSVADRINAKHLHFKLGCFKGTLAVIKLNGNIIDNAFCGDKKIPLRQEWLTGNDSVEIEIVGSLRNMMGPFHRKYTNCSRISWADFRTEGDQYTPEYKVLPYGLYGECAIVSDIPGSIP